MILSVDGGATKTFAAIADDSLNITGIGVAGPSNVRSVTPDVSKKNIFEAIENAKNMAGVDRVDKTFFGLAGYGDSVYHSKMLEDIVSFTENKYEITNDGEAATYLVTLGSDGVVTAIGTGSVGAYIKNGKTYRIGGWSYLTDDIASGYWISRKAIQFSEKSYDGLIENTSLVSILEECSGTNLRNFVSSLENNFDKRKMASIAIMVDREAELNDKISIKTLEMAYNEIKLMLDGMSSKMSGDFIMGSVGGVMRSRTIREKLENSYKNIKIFYGYHVCIGGLLKLAKNRDFNLRDSMVKRVDELLNSLSDQEKSYLFIE